VRRPSAQAQIFVCTNTSWLKFYSVLIYKCAELYTAEILASWDELLFPLIGLEHEYSTRAGKGDFLVKASLDCWASWSSILQRARPACYNCYRSMEMERFSLPTFDKRDMRLPRKLFRDEEKAVKHKTVIDLSTVPSSIVSPVLDLCRLCLLL
jgi:hypothetical protein